MSKVPETSKEENRTEKKAYLGYTVLYLGLLGMLILFYMLFTLSSDNPYHKSVLALAFIGAGLNFFAYFLVYDKSLLLTNILALLVNFPILLFVLYATGGAASPYWVLTIPIVIGWAFFVPDILFFACIGVLVVFFFGTAYSNNKGVFTTASFFLEFIKVSSIFLFGLWVKSILWESEKQNKDSVRSLEIKNKITQKLLSSFIASLSTAIARKDLGIQKHSERVIAHCAAIAAVLKLSESDKEKLFMAAMLHDVGKMSISDSILQKSGKLTKEEYEVIKKHPTDALSILEHIEELKGVLIYVKYHHERWDGNGYPEGLKGDMIPLIARILIVANSYDAMTTDKPYQAKMSKAEAISELKHCRGTQFDPKIVDIFIKILDT